MQLGSFLWYLSFTLVSFGLIAYGAHRWSIVWLFLKHRKDVPTPKSRFSELPPVTVQLPIYNELYVVDRLFDAVMALDYPKEKLHIQILDDSTDETVQICQDRAQKMRDLGFNAEHIHRVDRTGFKAGALENGLKKGAADILLILDADFVPNPDLLKKTVHFFTDPKVGMVQTRWGHLNEDYSLLTKIQGLFLDGHLMLEQTARSRSGRFCNFNGTAGLWNRACIEESGGWQHDTLTEDLDLSYRAQMRGWDFIFLNDLVTPAELPVDMDGFKNQQHRWTKGAVQTCLKILGDVFRASLPLKVKFEALAHLTANFSYILLILICFLMYPVELSETQENLRSMLNIPIFLMATSSIVAFYAASQIAVRPEGGWLKRLMYLPALLAVGVGMSINNAKAVFEALLHRESEFVRTPKYGIAGNQGTIKKKKYSALRSIGLVFEGLMTLYFLWIFLLGVMEEMWMTVPFNFLFLIGFAYVFWGSIKRFLPMDSQDDTRAGGEGNESASVLVS